MLIYMGAASIRQSKHLTGEDASTLGNRVGIFLFLRQNLRLQVTTIHGLCLCHFLSIDTNISFLLRLLAFSPPCLLSLEN